MSDERTRRALVVLDTPLGWMAIVGCDNVLEQLSFGHPSAQAAVRALDPALAGTATRGTWNPSLVRRLLAYAAGRPADFSDVLIDPGPLSAFQRQVIQHCRQIPYGKTLSYGELAAKAGSSRAARAVGNCMATNRIPLVVPCHRVLPASGQPGRFSAPGGVKMKRRLLAMEAGSVF
jgi:methylated-DNA-[protein]-cysteine S-methyltransferase